METMEIETLNDRRTDAERESTIGFIVATDRFMSGWGHAPGRSYFAVAFSTWDEAATVEANMRRRSEMKRVRVVGADYRPKLTDADHLSIAGRTSASRFFRAGGF